MQKHPLSGKVALITGAARRVGAEIAQILHKEGMNIVLHYNTSMEEAVKLCQQLNEAREHSASSIRADLQHVDSEKALVMQALKVWQRLDVVVNNASRFYRTNMGEVTDFAWNDLIQSNLKAPFFLSQAAAPYLKKSKGVILNIADIHAQKALRDYSVYCISKSGLIMMTKVLAKELGPDIRVNAILPGLVLWPEGKNALSPEVKEKLIKRTALQRAGCPSDVAKAVLYFIRDADYVTGQILSVDGGRLL